VWSLGGRGRICETAKEGGEKRGIGCVLESDFGGERRSPSSGVKELGNLPNTQGKKRCPPEELQRRPRYRELGWERGQRKVLKEGGRENSDMLLLACEKKRLGSLEGLFGGGEFWES